MSQIPESFILKGGLDLETPALFKDPGSMLTCVNYEPAIIAGYSRLQGYERFDGQASPTAATYHVLNFDAGADEPNVDDNVLGGTSAATGVIIAVTVTSGTWIDNDAAGYLVISKLTGTWVDDENIRDSGDSVTHAVVNGATEEQNEADDTLHNTYLAAARELYRDDILVVPGSGDIRGVWMYNGDVYAFRDNAGATACVMYKSSTAGWVAQDLGGSVEFNTGATAAPAAGDTITQAVTGATGILIEMVQTSGTFSGSDAVGRFHLKTITGTFSGTNNLSWTGGTATATSTTVNALPVGGRYEFINYNFKGQASSNKMYGCNGVGEAFQWDGTGFAFVYTGVASDTPSHIFAHRRHLFLSYVSSIQHSEIGKPLEWDALEGAGELATGDTVTGFLNIPGEALAIFNRNSTYILYGSAASGTDAWNLTTHSFESGAVEWSTQNIGTVPKYLDDRGITSLVTTQQYGDFKASTLSSLVETLVSLKLPSLVSSIRSREKDQYRLFFSDNTGLIMRDMGPRKGESFTTVEYPVEVKVTASVEDTTGVERLFFGSDDGYIYEMDKGDSFDGEDIDYSFRLAFNNLKSPRYKKRFFKVVLDMENTDVPPLSYLPDFSYGSPDIPGAKAIIDETIIAGGGLYDGNDNWGQFYFDGPSTSSGEAYLDGSGLNMSLLIAGSSNFEAPHKIHTATIHYGLRGLKK